jgi:hypothetical protein
MDAGHASEPCDCLTGKSTRLPFAPSPHTSLRLRKARRSNKCTSCSFFNSAPRSGGISLRGLDHDVERVLADIDTNHGNFSVECLGHGVLLVFVPLASLSLAGREHGRTIPLADFARPNYLVPALADLPRRVAGLFFEVGGMLATTKSRKARTFAGGRWREG